MPNPTDPKIRAKSGGKIGNDWSKPKPTFTRSGMSHVTSDTSFPKRMPKADSNGLSRIGKAIWFPLPPMPRIPSSVSLVLPASSPPAPAESNPPAVSGVEPSSDCRFFGDSEPSDRRPDAPSAESVSATVTTSLTVVMNCSAWAPFSAS